MTKTLYRRARDHRSRPLWFYRDRIEIDVTYADDAWWPICVLGVYRKMRRAGIGPHSARTYVVRMLDMPILPVRTVRGEPIEVAA